MKAKIPQKLWEAVGKRLATFNVSERELRWREWVEIDLGELTARRLDQLEALVEPHTRVRGAGTLLKDIRTWRRVAGGDYTVKPRSVEQFSEIVTRLLGAVPGHRVYMKHGERNTWLAYFVNDVTYHPARDQGDSHRPGFCEVGLLYYEFGVREDKRVCFDAEECLAMTPAQALREAGVFPETPELRADYLRDVARYDALHDKVGLQVWGVGIATDDLDGNDSKDRWSRWNRSRIRVDHTGEPARMVIDAFRETESEAEDVDSRMNPWFWPGVAQRTLALPDEEVEAVDADEEDDEDAAGDAPSRREPLAAEDADERPEIEVPIHPLVACFDMRRHLRIKMHVADLTEYAYDRHLSARLVLPPDLRALVEMLVSHRGAFTDIVAGKGGGVVVLCAGPPGVGKTLTAEVYAETLGRPLYSVQCSQLGTDPEELERQLLRVFARATRWNAILLLDEADVYIAARGDDLAQNAIVGVFLRVLEYYAGVLFLTTNRADAVDDAIASRCVARLDYAVPPPADQARIWEILARTAGVALDAATIAEVVARHPRLSGRDVKNLLKLAAMVSAARGGAPVTADLIDFVKRFKPTTDGAPAPNGATPSPALPLPREDAR